MEYLLAIASAALVFFNVVCWRNLRHLPRLPTTQWTEEEAPLVSVLIPARNEAARIEPCIHSLCQQEYPAYEVLVLDDESTDETLAVLERLQKQYPQRLRVLRGAPLPAGWVGKPWACWQLAQHARGAWFLFADADTVFHPYALASLMTARQRYGWRFVSVLPFEEMRSGVERLIIPLLYTVYFGYVPEEWRRWFRHFHAASGQAFLIDAQLYRSIGGHAAVRAELVEDLALGRLIAHTLGAAPVADGIHLVRCRMYETSADAIAGFSKNTYPAMGYRPWVLVAFLAHLVLLFIAPPVIAIAGIMTGQWLWTLLGGLSYGLMTMLRWQVSRSFQLPRSQIWLHPVAALVAALIALNSFWWSLTGRLRWKGRLYRAPSATAQPG
jgi:chlorobactene glucosyltransferase